MFIVPRPPFKINFLGQTFFDDFQMYKPSRIIRNISLIGQFLFAQPRSGASYPANHGDAYSSAICGFIADPNILDEESQ